MFHALHRIYVTTWVVLVLGGMVWLYPRTGISQPLMDWYAVWQNHPRDTVKPSTELSGTVVRVLNGATFTLQTPDRKLYDIGLLGVVPPTLPANSRLPETDAARHSRTFLDAMLLSNQVQVALTFLDAQHRGVGIAHIGETNVNAAMVESGLVKLKPEFIRSLPWHDQYDLLRAERKAGPHLAAQESQ
jgi:endonuclease YncB( thermonuclease family)